MACPHRKQRNAGALPPQSYGGPRQKHTNMIKYKGANKGPEGKINEGGSSTHFTVGGMSLANVGGRVSCTDIATMRVATLRMIIDNRIR